MVHNPALFDSRAWLHITNAIGWADYRPLMAELEAKPRDNAVDRTPGVTEAQMVAVTPPRKGRTSKRGSITVFRSVNQATQSYGRRVRTSRSCQSMPGVSAGGRRGSRVG